MRIVLLIISVACLGVLKAQNSTAFNLTFNQLTLSVKDVHCSAEFYKKVLSLNEIANRAKVTGMRWLSLGGNMELHLITIRSTILIEIKQIKK